MPNPSLLPQPQPHYLQDILNSIGGALYRRGRIAIIADSVPSTSADLTAAFNAYLGVPNPVSGDLALYKGSLWVFNGSEWEKTGEEGFQGHQGHQGFQGDQGFQGPPPNVKIFDDEEEALAYSIEHPDEVVLVEGERGSQGYQGHQGFQGFQGDQGSQGNQGDQGTQGAGTQGSQGFQGHQGSQGTQGQGTAVTNFTLNGTTAGRDYSTTLTANSVYLLTQNTYSGGAYSWIICTFRNIVGFNRMDNSPNEVLQVSTTGGLNLTLRDGTSGGAGAPTNYSLIKIV